MVSLPDAATADILQKLAQALAFFVGAVWVLLNYVLDRTHIRRLQLELETTVNQKEGRYHLVVTITVKNPGRSNVEITQKGSGLVISKLSTSGVVANVVGSQWDAEIALDIFTA